jgi:uncharacterized protein (DUF488 family)
MVMRATIATRRRRVNAQGPLAPDGLLRSSWIVAAGALIHSVGHSTRTIEDFLALIEAHGVRQIADVRAFAASRRLPHFNREPLAERLAQHGVAYRHMPGLGGRRRPRPDSPNDGWREAGFRAYADYMATPEFSRALSELREFAARAPTAVMCAEAVWWRCHRRLIADALVHAGVEVRHILSTTRAEPHEMTPFAVVRDGVLMYPGLMSADEST